MIQTFWHTFSAAPHRLFFFSGALQLLLPAVAWSLELLYRYSDIWPQPELIFPATWAHGMVMLYGLFIFFIYGFLMTVFPRWMGGELIQRQHIISTWLWLTSGLLIFEVGLYTGLRVALSGLLIFLLGWSIGMIALYQSFRQAPTNDKFYERLLLIFLGFGALGIISFAYWMYSFEWRFLELSRNIGIWLFLLPILMTVCHRMLPFFSSNVIPGYINYQPRALLLLLLAGCLLHFTLEQLYIRHWLFVIDGSMMLIAGWLSYRWQIHRSFSNHLLAVLHMAFLWLGIGLLLLFMQSLFMFVQDIYILDRAPLHALTIGFATSLLVAMASRVTLGHSGRQLVLDRISWYLFLGIQLAVIIRISADLHFESALDHHTLNLLAISLWLICLGIWVIRYAPIYLSRRVDGRDG